MYGLEWAFALGVGFGTFMFILSVGIFVLSVALFVKIWNMTNNIKKIKNILNEWIDLEHPIVDDDPKD